MPDLCGLAAIMNIERRSARSTSKRLATQGTRAYINARANGYCKSAGLRLHWFESSPAQALPTKPGARPVGFSIADLAQCCEEIYRSRERDRGRSIALDEPIIRRLLPT